MRTSGWIMAAVAMLSALSAGGETNLVTNVDDSGPGSLREAITLANTNAGLDHIHFAIPAAGVQTIVPLTDLPEITESVVIDGYTQPGAQANTLTNGNDAVLLIELTCTNVLNGLILTAGTNTVRGLVINGCNSHALLVANADANLIEGNYLGTDPTGSQLVHPNVGHGILISGSVRAVGNQIGGPAPGQRNLISGNGGQGVHLTGFNAIGNLILGNFIGTDATGTNAFGNGGRGVLIDGAPSNSVGQAVAGAGNAVVDNQADGIVIQGSGAVGNVVQGNFIGTDVTGTHFLGNVCAGLRLAGASGTLVGGTNALARNLIVATQGCAIGLVLDGATASQNVIQGNYIGVGGTGTNELPNTLGMDVSGGAHDNVIGGMTEGAGNVFSGNDGVGIRIRGSATRNNIFQGNWIGTDPTGLVALGNLQSGITISEGAGQQVIGGTEPGAGNIIAYNGQNGIAIFRPTATVSTNNTILGNAIFGNSQLGIELIVTTSTNDGPTPNDPCDVDGGVNQLQNFPVLTNATSLLNGSLLIAGYLDSAPATAFTVEFFISPECDPSGSGEGEFWLATTNLTTGADCTNVFTVTLPQLVPAGMHITATATDPAGNTSEFSPCQITENEVVVVACTLAPAVATNNIGSVHAVTATVTTNATLAAGIAVDFAVVSGPNTGIVQQVITDANGEAAFAYQGNGGPGGDTIRAISTFSSFVSTCTATKVWLATNNIPVAICRDITTNAPGTCDVTVTAAQVNNGSTDADGDPLTFSLSPAGPYAIGTTPVTLTVADNQGGTNSCNATITVRDVTPPTVSCPLPAFAELPPGALQVQVFYDAPSFADECTLVSTNASPSSGSFFPAGTNAVTVTAVDGGGNTNSCQFLVVVADASSEVRDLAITKLKAPTTVKLKTGKPPVTKKVSVTLQNRSPRPETIPNFAKLQALVTLDIESLGVCPAPAAVIDPKLAAKLPRTLKPGQTYKVTFLVTYDCANDGEAGPGHEDLRYVAEVHRAVLDGKVDTHHDCDVCPRGPLIGVYDNNSGKPIKDIGCGNPVGATGALGADVLTDVIRN